MERGFEQANLEAEILSETLNKRERHGCDITKGQRKGSGWEGILSRWVGQCD